MDPQLLDLAKTAGIGGVLALGMFLLYRQDQKRWTEAWKGQAEMLLEVVKENTAALTALKTIIERESRVRRSERHDEDP